MSQNALTDNAYGTSLPETQIEETDLAIERKMAKFSRTREFAQLKEHIEERITYYQSFLPTGEAVSTTGTTPEELGKRWAIANSVIAEFKLIIDAYENANEVVKEANRVQR